MEVTADGVDRLEDSDNTSISTYSVKLMETKTDSLSPQLTLVVAELRLEGRNPNNPAMKIKINAGSRSVARR